MEDNVDKDKVSINHDISAQYTKNESLQYQVIPEGSLLNDDSCDNSNDFDGAKEDDELDFEELPSFKDAKYESKEMKYLLSLNEPHDKIPAGLNDVTYKGNRSIVTLIDRHISL
jgi:hypothetical protein